MAIIIIAPIPQSIVMPISPRIALWVAFAINSPAQVTLIPI